MWDHWFKPPPIVIKKEAFKKPELAPVPVDPFNANDREQWTKLMLMHNTGNYEGALKLANDLLAGNSIEPPFREWLTRQLAALLTTSAWLKIQGGDCDEGIKLLYKAVQISPLAETKKGLGVCMHAAKNWPEAASWLSSFVFEKPNDLDGRLLLADSMESLGRFDEAVAMLEGGIGIDGLTEPQKAALADRLQAMKVKATEGVRQKSEYSRRFFVSFREEEHESLLATVFEVLEASVDEFSEVLGLEPILTPIEVILYRKEAFHDVIPGGPEWSEGIFDGRIRVPVSADMSVSRIELLTTILRHELVHALLAHKTHRRQMPTWFDEGLAQYLACRNRSCSGFKFGVTPGSFLPSQKLIEPFITLSTIEAGMAYKQSLYLIRLLVSAHGDDGLRQTVKTLPPTGPLQSQLLVQGAGFENFDSFVVQAAQKWQEKAVF